MHEQPAQLRLEHESCGVGRVKVIASLEDRVVHMDVLDPASAFQRNRFVKAIVEKVPEADRGVVETELVLIAETLGARKGHEQTGEQQDAQSLLAAMPAEARQAAEAMLLDKQLIKRVIDDVSSLGVAGERETTATVYIIGVSRLLDRPLAGIVQGPSASGKSYLIEKAAALFPRESVLYATQMTPQALFHMRPGSLAHRFVVAGERSRLEDDERAEATRALREMLSAGRLTKLIPVKVDGNRIETVQIEQDGPIAYVESTTLAKVFDEDANRCVMLNTDEQPQQTRRIIDRFAANCGGESNGESLESLVQRHHALQRMLKPLPVVIPYARKLGELFPADRVEARRAFRHLVSLIQAVTLLHQFQRATDLDGRLVATAEDYHLARHLLLKPLARQLGRRLSDPARRFYDRLQQRVTGCFTTTEAKKSENSSPSSVHGWLSELLDAGAVELVEEGRGRSPAKWRLNGTDLAEGGSAVLPPVTQVCPETGSDVESEVECERQVRL